MNEIAQRQNQPDVLQGLAASRRAYSKSKALMAISMVLSVPVAVALSVLVLKVPEAKPAVAAWGILLAFLNLALERLQRDRGQRAALMQELFDCDVLALDWNSAKGKAPSPEELAGEAHRFGTGKELDQLRDWYPKGVALLPHSLARIICQRANCSWEKGQRESYSQGLLGILGIAIVAIVVVAFAAIKTFDDFVLLVMAPALPAVLLVVRQYFEHRDAARSSERLLDRADALFEEALSQSLTEDQLRARSRALQDDIFERRRTSPPVFDWAYQRLRSVNESAMNAAAEALVAKARRAISGSPTSGVGPIASAEEKN